MKACKPCRNAVLACALCTFALPATAAEYPDLEGDIVKELRFQDKSGENAVVLTEREKIREQEGSSLWSKDIRAYRYRLQGDAASQAWQIHDYVHDCETSVTAGFLQDEIAITDLDDNGQSEIWVPYLIRCAGDVSPSTMKIIMYEGQKKHALRGRNPLRSTPCAAGTLCPAWRATPASRAKANTGRTRPFRRPSRKSANSAICFGNVP